MQPSPRTAPPGACGTPPPPPPTSGGSNAFRRNRPHKHGALAPNAASTPPPPQPLTDPFAFGRQGSPSTRVSSQTPPLHSSPLPMQATLAAGFNQTGPPLGPLSGAQVPIAGPVHTFSNPHPGPSGHPLAPNPGSTEPGYFSSQEPMPYIAQLPNSVPPFSTSTMHAPPAALTVPVQSTPLFPTLPATSHSGPDHGSRPPSVQNYFQPTSDTPQSFHPHIQAQGLPSVPLPHPGPFQSHTQNHSQSAINMGEPAISQQQNSHFSTQGYFSQTGGVPEPWFNQAPQDPMQRSGPVPHNVPFTDPGTLSMFFHGNDVENVETLSGEGHVNGVSHPPQSREVNEMLNPSLNETVNVKMTAGPCDSVENLECVPNQEVLPNEPPSTPAYEAGPNLETPDSASRPARSASVSSSYSNVSHSSGHAPHSSSHPPRRHQGVVGTFIQQESPRPPDAPASHPSAGGYFEQIDSAPAPELSPTFPTPSPPKPVGVFQASANSSFEPVRSHVVGVRPAEVDRARMVMEKRSDILPGNLEQPPDNMETIYFPGGQDRRPSSRAQGSRRPSDSPATTLWAQSDAASLGANILLAPAAPPLATTTASSCQQTTEIIQPPEDVPLDLQPPRALPQPPSENLENPPDSATQVTKDSQQGARVQSEPPLQPPTSNPPRAPSNQSSNGPSGPSNPTHPASQYYPAPHATPVSQATSSSTYLPQSGDSVNTHDPQRPPSSLGSQHGFGVPPPMPPAPGFSSYYPEYQDGRHPFPPPDPRVQNYYQDDAYRRGDPPYGRYNGPNPGYREADRQPERPSSRTSQYSDRPNSRQGYAEDYPRSNRSAYEEYYANYYKFMDQNRWYDPNAMYDPRYRGYYDQTYGWYNYDPEAYGRADPYFSQQYSNRREGYDDPWRYYPGYDASFDDDCRRRDTYGDELERRSVHSERSTHSRRSSFSSRSQQSQVYRSQPDLVAASYEATATTMPADYSYSQFPEQTDTLNYSQYNAENSTWAAPEQAPPRPLTPEKYAAPHCCARFGPAGQLIFVQPNLPSAGQPALVEIHSIETMMQDFPEQAELRAFPGPLVKEETHKVDVIKFAQNKAQECLRNDDLIDKDSAFLIWEFIVLLCRQNGTVVGTDIADLLLKEHRSVWLPGKSPNEANLIDFNNEALERAEEEGTGPLSLLSDTFMGVAENVGKETERFRELLLFGRKKDALEAAMKNGLWGHALLLASKMDNRTHARVMTRFANSLPINDPLQTVYQLMSGRMPASASCCGDEKWGDWRPHLAMVLSNLTHALDLDTRTISTMGDTLASKGLLDAAHFCYLMAQVGLGVFTKKSTKIVLIGSNHSLPFAKFCSTEAIQRTEAYEYAQSLGSQPLSLPNYQVYKFIYACRLAEAGLCAQAFHYCEVISRALLTLPTYHSPVFISQIIQMSERLRFFDPQLKEKPEQELFQEPEWLLHLRTLSSQIKDGVIMLRTDRSTPQPSACTTPSSEEQASPVETSTFNSDPHNPLMSTLMPQLGPSAPGVQLMPPAPTAILQDGSVSLQHGSPPNEGVPFNSAVTAPPQPGYIPQYQTEDQGPYSSLPAQSPTLPPPNMPPQIPQYTPMEIPPQLPPQTPSQMSPHMSPHFSPHMPPHMPPHMSPHLPPHNPHQVPGVNPTPTPPSPQQLQPSSPSHGPPSHMDFYDNMAQMSTGRRSRTTSQSSVHRMPGRRSRTTSESSTHSTGRERSNSLANQSSPPPPIPEAPVQEAPKKNKKDSPKKGGGGGIFGWIYRRGKNEVHLPDDKNKSIVWDETKQKWVNLDEPEEEKKPLPPPPSMFPNAPMGGNMGGGPPSGPAAGPSVNMFSRKAGTRARYVDVFNSGRRNSNPAPAVAPPADLFAPLAPMAMPANLFVPTAAPDDRQPMEGSVPDSNGNTEHIQPNATGPQMFNPTILPSGPEGAHSGEVPTEIPAQGPPPTGGVTFYNPSQFAQAMPPARSRLGRLGQREYPTLK